MDFPCDQPLSGPDSGGESSDTNGNRVEWNSNQPSIPSTDSPHTNVAPSPDIFLMSNATAEQRFWEYFHVMLDHILQTRFVIPPETMRPLYQALLLWQPNVMRIEWADLMHHKKAGCEDFGPYDCIRDGVGVLIDGYVMRWSDGWEKERIREMKKEEEGERYVGDGFV